MRARDGSQPSLRRTSVSTTYQFSGRPGKSLLEFTVPEPGAYLFSRGYDQGQSGPQVVLAVGSGIAANIFVSIGSLFAGLGCGFTFAAVAAVIIYLKQRRSRRNATEHSPGFPAASQ